MVSGSSCVKVNGVLVLTVTLLFCRIYPFFFRACFEALNQKKTSIFSENAV